MPTPGRSHCSLSFPPRRDLCSSKGQRVLFLTVTSSTPCPAGRGTLAFPPGLGSSAQPLLNPSQQKLRCSWSRINTQPAQLWGEKFLTAFWESGIGRQEADRLTAGFSPSPVSRMITHPAVTPRWAGLHSCHILGTGTGSSQVLPTKNLIWSQGEDLKL